MTAGARPEDVEGGVNLQFAVVSEVVGPEVAALVADGEGPDTGGLAEQLEHIIGVGGDEGRDVVRASLVVGNDVEGGVSVRVRVKGAVCASGAGVRPPGEAPEALDRFTAVGRGEWPGELRVVKGLKVVDAAIHT